MYYADPVHTDVVVDYELRPPAGGIHNPVWWNCGFYDEAVPDEHVVHDLEHGAVWLAYAPDLDAADVDVIHDLARANAKVVAAPYPDLAAGRGGGGHGLGPPAARSTRWTTRAWPSSWRSTRTARRRPEAGASCAGGPLGEPIP